MPAQTPEQPRTPAVGLPVWLDLGMLLMAVGALLVAVGFFLYAGGIGNINPYGFFQAFGILVGIGVLIAVLGWLLHKMIRARAEASGPRSG